MRCTRCHRNLSNPPILVAGQALGPTCARQMGYRQHARVARAQRPDERQGVLPLENPA